MNGKWLLLAGIWAVLPVQARAAEDELCKRLRSFQAASFDKDAEGKPLRRAVEFHWVGAWLDLDTGFGTQCRDGGTQAGKTLCSWLPEHTSIEFPDNLPMDILRCFGWKIPAYASDWGVRKGSFDIHTNAQGSRPKDSDRYLQLEIDMRARKKAHTAIRLSVIPWDEKHQGPRTAAQNQRAGGCGRGRKSSLSSSVNKARLYLYI